MSDSDKFVQAANPKACAHCPWRIANQGKADDPHGFYTKKNLKFLWSKLRKGDRMTCHPTDDRMVEFEHAPQPKSGASVHECTGALILQQREFMKYQSCLLDEKSENYPYRTPNMTKIGLIEIVQRVIFNNTPFGGTKMRKLDIADPEIGYAPLGEFKPDELTVPE